MMTSTQPSRHWRLFQRADGMDRAFQIIWWWETRRIPFNVIVGLTGVVTCLLGLWAFILMASASNPSSTEGSPFLAVMMVILYGICANLCYTLGWLGELLARKVWKQKATYFGEIAFGLGMFFSILLTLLPALLFTIIIIATIVTGLFKRHA